ncbi:glycoside hydrolase family 19 protein [Paractinoplanes rhizophilus]|jgi:chitodextrinase/predicted chitinase|uniref:Glycoside hydrolase family 19 protein n=1 Tax=Paractinoplanes rhizophilus TaxID=1416877 RepID=A0ABW2HMK8_9ACTN|nr:glycoside hydrolase family 19 protein [Actinoplanes sp.]
MTRKRLLTVLAAAVISLIAAAGAVIPSTASDAAAACVTPYNSAAVYTGGMTASYNGHNWTAKWWTQGEAPSTGGSGVWQDNGSCGGSSGGGGGGTCNYPNWVAGQYYAVGAIVRYTNGLYYQATHENPGYDPTISTWFWSPYNCSGGGGGNGGGNGGFVVSEAQFNQMFPGRNSFYTYAGLTDAMRKFPAFATTGSDTVRRQEAAAFLANVSHETGGLVYIDEINQANWPHYCDYSQPYGCPAGQSAYHGRGPIQLSWNFNYYAAGNALGVDLLNNPGLVGTNSSISWQTGLWYWMTGTGNAGTTSHNAMVNGQGFGTTIRAINSIECNGGNPAQVQSRITLYTRFAGILGVGTGGNLSC